MKAKGYDYRFVFSRGTGHCDKRVFEQTLADTLVWAWRGYEGGENGVIGVRGLGAPRWGFALVVG